MKIKTLVNTVTESFSENRRLVAPLVGFPGINLTNSTIKLAQQNVDEHFKVIKANVEVFKPDAVFTLMDLSVEANALGMHTYFPKNEAATVVKAGLTDEVIEAIKNINIEYDTRIRGYVDVVKRMKMELPNSILRGAYVSGPYTLAALITGADEAAMATIMNSEQFADLCEITTEKIKSYMKLLVEAGAQMICILEPTAVMLGPDHFEKYSAKYIKKIVDEYSNSNIAIILHVCGNTMPLIEKMCESGVDALSLDSAEAGVDLYEVAKRIPKGMILMGNINPVGTMLNGKPEDVENETQELLQSMKEFPNFILSTGCDLPQNTPTKNINAFMKSAKNKTK